MRSWTKWRPSPSMGVAMLALFVALGGSALAVKKDGLKIRSKNIVNGQVKTPDLAKNAVTSVKILNGQVKAPDIGPGAVGSSALAPGAVGSSALAPGAVGGLALAPGSVESSILAPNSVGSQHVQNDSLTGDDIDESSLHGVNAQTLGGASRCGESGRIDVNNSSKFDDKSPICTVGPFAFYSYCEAQGGGSLATGAVQIEVAENDAFYSTNGIESVADDPSPSDADWDAGEVKAVVWHAVFAEGAPTVSPPVVFNAFASSGAHLSGQASVRVISRNDGTRSCDFVLSAIG